jgi:hypothetical protein
LLSVDVAISTKELADRLERKVEKSRSFSLMLWTEAGVYMQSCLRRIIHPVLGNERTKDTFRRHFTIVKFYIPEDIPPLRNIREELASMMHLRERMQKRHSCHESNRIKRGEGVMYRRMLLSCVDLPGMR